MNINELPTMEFHFFEKPNNITISDASFNLIMTAELDFNFDFDFVLDAKSFDMIKRLSTNRKINLEKNTIIIESREGKYKCQNISKKKPDLKLNDADYTHTYDSTKLKEATNFISDNKARAVLTGVLLNDVGDIFASDTIKFFYYRPEILSYSRFWSIPVYFIRLLPQGEVTLNFTNTKVWFEGEYNIYSNVYDTKVPKIEQICDNFKSDEFINIDKREELKFLESESIEINVDYNQTVLIFNDGEKVFKVEYDMMSHFQKTVKIDYERFNQAISILGDKLFIEFNQDNKSLRINKKVILSYRR